ncbi:hypothetical protein PRK78_004732 [Emydomyces testavorans]|uniref:Uncharacterized protein n=1 Tax=Emydomyces testavorans TaxID=2070801 RepID=A0AAF0IJH0_9EURO|nr:hypothetical protein PRK78_004732 [Emydomyces testavorans]
MPGHVKRELSSLVKWSQASGAMWLHMLLLSGFNDHRSFRFTQLRQYFGNEWTKREQEINNAELEVFAARKVSELDEYDEALEKREEDKALMYNGKITKGEFIANTLMEPGSPPVSSLFLVSDGMRSDKSNFEAEAVNLSSHHNS